MHFGLLLQLVAWSFLGMKGEFTHTWEFWLTDDVGMFYPQNKSVPSIELHWTLANFDATSAYLFNLCKSPELSAYQKECNFFTWFLEFVLPSQAVAIPNHVFRKVK